MRIKQDLMAHANWANIPPEELQALLDAADEVCTEPGEFLTRQYHPAEYFYLLHSGSLSLSIQLDKSGEQLPVGKSDQAWSALGWSGFRAPHRYTVTHQCAQACRMLRWDRVRLQALLVKYPRLGQRFLDLVMVSGLDTLTQTRNLLVRAARLVEPMRQTHGTQQINQLKLEPSRIMPLLQRSSFFEGFNEAALNYMAGKATLHYYKQGDRLATDDAAGAGLYMLVTGAVALYFTPTTADTMQPGAVFIRSLDGAGQIVAWSSATAPQAKGLSAVVSRDALLCFIASDALEARVQQQPSFGLSLASRLLYLIGNQLRSTRAQLTNQQYQDECFSIRSLLQQTAPQLSVSSPLHNVPHLLANRLTQAEGFRSLEQVKSEGNALEKNLAGIFLDLLAETRRECKYYQGLLKVYENVVTAPAQEPPEQVRGRCDSAIADALKEVRYIIRSQENLPDDPGHIFILNHLVNHPYNALPNYFELAMDTHFVAAMILRPKYGDSGVRVVRKPRNEEYGHQDYYNRLGYIYVQTRESEQGQQNTGASQLEAFVAAARDTLLARSNLVICPEGTSLWSEESPGPFKPGAFYLAGSVDPEPLIVPIAVANFDKYLRNTTLAAIIKPPFRISDYVDVRDREALSAFLRDYRENYRGYVREAQQLADSAGSEDMLN